MHLFATSTAEQLLELGKVAGVVQVEQPRGGQTASAAPAADVRAQTGRALARAKPK